MNNSQNTDIGNRIASEILMAGGTRSRLQNGVNIYAISLFESYAVLKYDPRTELNIRYTLQIKLFRTHEMETSIPAEMLSNWQVWHATILNEVANTLSSGSISRNIP